RYQALVLGFNKPDNFVTFQHNGEQISLSKKGSETDGQEEEGKDGQICSQCADYLVANLHKQIEDIQASNADDIVSQWRKVGGFLPAALVPLLSPETLKITNIRQNTVTSGVKSSKEPTPSPTSQLTHPVSDGSTKFELTLEQRLTLAFLKTDLELMNSI
ncbi:7313_t:CDS:2, partial [Racocetra fulgida]